MVECTGVAEPKSLVDAFAEAAENQVNHSLCTASLSHSTNIPPLVFVMRSYFVALKMSLSSYLALTLCRSHTHQRYTAVRLGALPVSREA